MALLPAPVEPTMASVVPPATSRETPRSTGCVAGEGVEWDAALAGSGGAHNGRRGTAGHLQGDAAKDRL